MNGGFEAVAVTEIKMKEILSEILSCLCVVFFITQPVVTKRGRRLAFSAVVYRKVREL